MSQNSSCWRRNTASSISALSLEVPVERADAVAGTLGDPLGGESRGAFLAEDEQAAWRTASTISFERSC